MYTLSCAATDYTKAGVTGVRCYGAERDTRKSDHPIVRITQLIWITLRFCDDVRELHSYTSD